MPQTQSRNLTTTQAAVELGVTRRTILNWITTGKINATRPLEGETSPYVIPRAEVDRLLAEQRQPA